MLPPTLRRREPPLAHSPDMSCARHTEINGRALPEIWRRNAFGLYETRIYDKSLLRHVRTTSPLTPHTSHLTSPLWRNGKEFERD